MANVISKGLFRSWRRSLVIAAMSALTFLSTGSSLHAQAPADPKGVAKGFFDKGAAEYNLGHFAESIRNFEQAYALDPAPILIFNIAQCHRQNGENERALFFYRRYLEQAPKNAANRSDVERRVKDIEEVLAQQTAIKRKPPTEVEKQGGAAGVTSSVDATSASGGARPATSPPPVVPATTSVAVPAVTPAVDAANPPAPTSVVMSPAASNDGDSTNHPFVVGADVGLAFPQFHGQSLDQPGLFVARVFGAYAVLRGPLTIDVGASLSFGRLPYKDTLNVDHSSSLTGLLATGGLSYDVAPGFSLTGELAAGVMWWSGIGEDNPFTADGSASSGAIPMPTFRIAAGLRYRISDGLFVYFLPAFSVSKTTSGLQDSISSLTRIDLPVGLGYRF